MVARYMPRRSLLHSRRSSGSSSVALLAMGMALVGESGCGDHGPESAATTAEGGESPEAEATPPEDGGGMATGGRTQVVLASLGALAGSLRVDSSNAYLASFGQTTTIVQVPLSGAAPIQLASGQAETLGLAVSGATVYWANEFASSDEDSLDSGVIVSAPVGGGALTILASGQALPSAIAADSAGVYWADSEVCQTTVCSAQVMTLAPDGGAPVVLSSAPTFVSALALDAANVYWATSNGRLMSVPRAGGTATMLAFYQTTIEFLVVRPTGIYWTAGGDIMETPLDGGASTALVVSLDTIAGLDVDSTSVYWATDGSFEGTVSASAVKKVALGGGTPTTLWSGSDSLTTLQVDPTSVYFTTESGDLIKLTPK